MRSHDDLVVVPVAELGEKLKEACERSRFVVDRLKSGNVFDEDVFRKIAAHEAMEFAEQILAGVVLPRFALLLRERLTGRAGAEDDRPSPSAGADVLRDILHLQAPDVALDEAGGPEVLAIGSSSVAVEIDAEPYGESGLPHSLTGAAATTEEVIENHTLPATQLPAPAGVKAMLPGRVENAKLRPKPDDIFP
jgi:hypothetical protein